MIESFRRWLQTDQGADAVLAALALSAILAALVVLGQLTVRKRRMFRTYPGRETPPRPYRVAPAAPDLSDPAQQILAIQNSRFERVRLLNKEEARVLPVLERTLREINSGHRVMAQTALGEVIRPVRSASGQGDPAADAAFASINSKRLDFAIIDRFGMLVCAIEYQGTGHYQGKAFMRDAVKKEALRKAGVPTIEVMPDFDAPALAAQVLRLLAPTPPSTPGAARPSG